MKIAYLVLAHNQPDHLFRMINTLNSANVSFFVHIDKKSNIANFNCEQYPENVHFLEDRIVITHAGFSMVRAILKTMKAALSNSQNEYFILLSGWDYPIKSNDYINEYLIKSYPMNFLSFYPLIKGAEWVDNIRRYNIVDFSEQSPPFMRIPLKGVKFFLKHFPLYRKFIEGLIPYRGSSSFCLNRKTIDDIIEFLDTEKGRQYEQFFKNVSCSDEIFFHTIILNSSNAQSCRYYKRDIIDSKTIMKNENKAYLHYIDWDSKRENPAWFDMTDFEKLTGSEALFARKFNETKSRAVLDALDEHIRPKL